MTRISTERDRLLASAARATGMTSTALALLCLSLPRSIQSATYPAILLSLLVLGFCQYRLVSSGPIVWLTATVVVGAMAIGILGAGTGSNPAAPAALAALGAGSLGSAAIMLTTSRRRIALLIGGFVLTQVMLGFAFVQYPEAAVRTILVTVSGWGICTITGVWLARAVPRVMARISSMNRAYRTQRQASETEARRRQNARLLHDTVLATLTLLAHSGVGVSEDAMREQAREDSALLRQLRLGATPSPRASGSYALTQVEESTLGKTLESVKQRFRRMGLEVSWHGSGQVLLPPGTLDAFLLAVGECLENVRRHAGTAEADVTITDDDTTVRAMVTDAGVGFDRGAVDSRHLGFTESIVARLSDVGGNARIFSSPGAGTTVVLEVPK